MADYHPLIARAVSGLEKNTGEARRTLYERARVALVAQLRGVVPALEESEITRERLALEEAIRKVEAEAARQARESARPNVIKRAEAARQEAPPRQEAPRPEAPPRPVTPRAPITPSTLSSPRPISTPPDDAPRRAPFSNRGGPLDDALNAYREAPPPPPEPRRPRPPAISEPLPAPPPPPEPAAPERHPLEEYGQLEPQMQPDNLWALPLDSTHSEPPVDLDARQPPPPRYDSSIDEQMPSRREPRSYGNIIRVGLVLALVVVIGSLVWWQRSTIANIGTVVATLFQSSPSAPPKEAAAPARPKIADRIGQPQASGGPAVAQRVVLYEEEPDDPQGKRFVGTVLWRTEMRPATLGRPPKLAVRGDVEIPERQMSVTMSFRRNTDASLPASHTIEIVFTLPSDTPSGGVQKVPGVLMKQAEQTRGVPLAGLAVPVTPGYFLIGLSSLESDMQRNVQLLKERGWFDIPIIYNNNRRAILALEKGTPGEQAFSAAFAAWKQ